MFSELVVQAGDARGLGGEMPILGIHQHPSLTQERYEAVVRHLTNGKPRIETPDDLPFSGLIVHGAGHSKNGFCVIDVFDTQAAVRAFQEAVGTKPREAGIEEPPDFFTAFTFYANL